MVGGITAMPSAVLTLEPGTRVELEVLGTPAERVVITGATERPSYRRGIQIRNTGSTVIEHADIRYGSWSECAKLS